MTIRQIKDDKDIDRALNFARECFDATIKKYWSSEGIDTFYSLIRSMRTFPGFVFYESIDESDGRTLGLIAADSNISHIYLLFVSPDQQKKGIGTSLLKYAENISTEIGMTVNAEPTAVGFYELNGFKPVKDEFDLKDGIRTLKMFKKIK